jgi:magnesium transporter
MAIINPLSLIKKSFYAKKVGKTPGEFIYAGEKKKDVKMTLIKYNEVSEDTIQIDSFEHLLECFEHDKINWINLDGVGDIELMKQFASHFQFSDLMTEDIMNTEHLPKSEVYEKHLFFTMKSAWLERIDGKIDVLKEHISFILGKHYVITFQDSVEGDVFNVIRQRIKSNKGRIRKFGEDYLFYSLIDSAVDQFFLVMEYIREQIEDMEDYILSNPSENMNEKIILLRRKILEMRRMIHFTQEAVKKLIWEESDFLDVQINPFLNDLLDHTHHLNSSFDSFREYVNSIMEMYMSNLSNNLNVIMKTLTIFSLFFVPLTFLAGIYGMNFAYMPELQQKWGYPIVILIMLGIVGIMYMYMKRKKWL